MANEWKQAISDFLNTGKDRELRARLRTEWVDFYPEEKVEIFRFLFLAKQFKIFLYFFAIDLQSQITDLPWTLFLRIFDTEKYKFPEKHFIEIKKVFAEQKLSSGLTDNFNDLISELKTKNRHHFLQRVTKTKQELIASARIAKSEQLIEQHIHYINELKKIAPNEYNVAGLISEQEKRQAERVLQKRAQKNSQNSFTEPSSTNAEEAKLIGRIEEQAKKYLKSKNVKPSDLAYLFRTFGDDNKAIDFIYLNSQDSHQDWQLLDYLFSGKQYLSLLDHCMMMRKKYEAFPDQLFSISYAEAVALWGLGEKDKAIELMNQIASMRPDFKSATETLSQWKEDSFE